MRRGLAALVVVHTAATAPLFSGLTVTVAISVFAIVEPVFGLRA